VSVVALGPSGNGKTEFFRTIAEAVYGDESRMGMIDMGEMLDGTDVTRLLGASPKYVGYGQSILLDKVKPFAEHDETTKVYTVRGVILFDEMDKAHEQVYDAVMQLLDEGRITLGNGEVIDVSQAVVGFSGNYGTSAMKLGGVGFTAPVAVASSETSAPPLTDQLVQGLRVKAKEAWEKATRTEFRNRVKLVLNFDPLSDEHLKTLAQRKLDTVLERARTRNKLSISYDDAVLDKVVHFKLDRLKGGRSVTDNIENLVNSVIEPAVMARKRGTFQLRVSESGDIALGPRTLIVIRGGGADALAV